MTTTQKTLNDESYLQAAFDALSSHIAILDGTGIILTVNAAWRAFAEANGLAWADYGLGRNYLQVCDSVSGHSAAGARAAADGIRQIIAGQRQAFSLEYPCHSPALEQWFLLRATRFQVDGSLGVVITHEDITDRKRMKEMLRERTHDLDERVKELDCLYQISELTGKPGISVDEIVQQTLTFIPPAWQYPEITAARVTLEDREWRTGNFTQTPWRCDQDIVVQSKPIGSLEVCYLEERPRSDEGPFLQEEMHLLWAIAEQLGRSIEHVWAEETLAWEASLQTAMAALYKPLVSPFTTIDEIGSAVLEQARRLTGSAHGYVSLIDPITGEDVNHTLTEMVPGSQQDLGTNFRAVLPRGSNGHYPGLSGHALNTLEGFYTNAPETHPAFARMPTGHTPLCRFLCVPVLLGEELVGQITLANAGRDYTDRDLEAMERLAEFYALSIQRHRVEETLRKERDFLTNVLESLSHPFYVLDANDYSIQIANRAARLGDFSDGGTCYAVTHRVSEPCSTEEHPCPIEHVKRTKEPVTTEHVHFDADGGARCVEVHGYPLFDEAGEVIRIIEYTLDVTERNQAQEELRRLTHDLGERVKELNCLYGVSKLAARQDITLEEVFQGTVEILPPAFQYPEVTGARIIWEGQEFGTLNFQETTWKLAADLVVNGQPIGVLEVCQLEQRTEWDQGAFLKEERHLIEEVAERLGRIAERTWAEQALRMSENQYRQLVETLNEGIWRVDRDGRTTFVNPRMAEMLGYNVEEMQGKHLSSFLDEQSRPITATNLHYRQQGPKEQLDLEFLRRDGSRFYASVEMSPLVDEEGNYAGALAGVQDVTERRLVERALQKSEALLKETQKIAKVGGWELDLKDNRVAWTEEVYRIHEVPLDFEPDLEGALSFYVPEDRPILEQALGRAVESGEPWDLELRFITAKGKGLWVRAIGKAEHEDGRVVKLSGTFQDITERRQAEDALRESELRWRSLTETSPDHILTLDTDLRIQFANSASPGLSVDDLIGTPLYTWVDEARQAEIKAILENVLQTGTPARYETVYPLPDGGKLHYESHVVARTPGGSGLPIGLTVSARDITERKQAEEALAWQEAELRATIYSIGEAVIATDTEGRVSRMNPVAWELTGWSEVEAVGKWLPEIFNIVNRETRHPLENPVARVLREGAVVGLADRSLLIACDGRAVPITGAGAPILDLQGNLSGVVLVFRDQTEEHLRQRSIEVRLSLIEYAANHTLDELLTQALDEIGAFVESPIGFYHFVEPDQRTLSLQQWSTRTVTEFCEAEGRGVHYSIDQAGVWVDCVREKRPVVHNDYASLPHKRGLPEGHAEVVRELVVPVLRGDRVLAILGVGNKPTEYTPQDVEVVSYLADVTWEIVRQKRAEEALRQARDELQQRVEERTAELVQINMALKAEIAERQRAEEDLRSSEERFRQLANHINHVFWIADLATNQPLYVSRAYEELWGQARRTLYEQPTSFFEAVHPEDRKRVEVALERASQEEQVEQFRLVRPDGSVIWVQIRVFPVRDEQGRPYRLAGIAEDISEQVQAVQLLEQRVEERTRQLSALLQIASSMTLTLELGSMLDLVLDGLQALVEYDVAVIYELAGEELVAVAHRALGSLAEMDQGPFHLVESAIAQRALSAQEPLSLSDIQGRTEDSLLASASDWAVCGMAVRLGIRERVVGLLVLYSKQPQVYSKQQAALLLALANQAAVSIENAHLYQQAHALAAIEERQRLARDLHDAVSQTLFSANIIAEALPRIWDRDPESVRRRLPELHRLTSGALAEMRTLLLELRPTALVEVELGELLQQAIDAFSGRTRTVASLTVVGQRPLPGAVQIALYRIAQEALNNVTKHANATEAAIHLLNEPNRVELRIQDNGRGFAPDHIPPGSMGFTILQERARAIGATLEVSSQPGDGTQIVVVWTETP